MILIIFRALWRINLILLFLTLPDRVFYAHIIRTKLGYLEGITKVARDGKLFHAYYGIPYAKAPVGKLRFEPPVEAGAWVGILNATKPPVICSQVPDEGSEGRLHRGQEDCLFVDVYTPKNAKPGSNIPVVIYIYGGIFRFGDTNHEGLQFVMTRDIIFVMISYRLGVLGLLSTGDTAIPGNMALKDQTMAMKWTKENIYDFGGNPRRITLQGHSSGAACVHLHTLSPLSKNYFNQVIIQSGLGVNPQNFRDRDSAVAVTRAFAARVNCSTRTSYILKRCLQKKKVEDLVEAADGLRILKHEPAALFRPVVEDENVRNAFLTRNPLDAPYVSHKKPWLIGMTTDEASSYVSTYFRDLRLLEVFLCCSGGSESENEIRLHDMLLEPMYCRKGYFHPDTSILNTIPKLLFPIIGCFEWTTKPNHVNFIAQILKTHFFGEEKIRDSDITDIALVKILTGIMHGYGFIDVIQKYKGVKYAYLFDYRFLGGFTTSLGGRGGRFIGVSHADELPLLYQWRNSKGISAEDYTFGDEMITRWINFVYSGNPNGPFPINVSVFGPWEAVSSPRIEFLRINNNGSMEDDYFLKEFDFYRKIPFFSNYR